MFKLMSCAYTFYRSQTHFIHFDVTVFSQIFEWNYLIRNEDGGKKNHIQFVVRLNVKSFHVLSCFYTFYLSQFEEECVCFLHPLLDLLVVCKGSFFALSHQLDVFFFNGAKLFSSVCIRQLTLFIFFKQNLFPFFSQFSIKQCNNTQYRPKQP